MLLPPNVKSGALNKLRRTKGGAVAIRPGRARGNWFMKKSTHSYSWLYKTAMSGRPSPLKSWIRSPIAPGRSSISTISKRGAVAGSATLRSHSRRPVSRQPNVAVRVFLPPIAQWERRNGPSFAFRISLEPGGGGETYWPGMFVEFAPKEQTKLEYDTASIRIRGDRSGRDFKAKQITETGWWTLGMSVTGDGMVHYYASPGVDDLTDEDHITSQYPYGTRARSFNTFFFNVCNGDDGRTWSTPWIIDDCTVYVAN